MVGAIMTDQEFKRLRDLVHAQTGIALGPQKRCLLETRLGRRLRALGLQTFGDYERFLAERDPRGAELGQFVNAVTTNKTDFFREAHHFQYLAEEWLPAVRAEADRTGARSLRIWSAACSSGEEPYTIAMVVREGLGAAAPGWDVKILASDIDTDVLARAAEGVYSLEQVEPVPRAMLARHFLRGTGASAGRVRVRPEVAALVAFRRINFLDDPWPIRLRFDAVFCRNALIYFDRATQQRILERMAGLLKDGGLLFLGHSESLYGLLTGFTHLGQTIYRRAAA
jgi:chemotaxis protein methyltransferase CheR